MARRVLGNQSLFVELSQDVGRLLVLNYSLAFLNDLLLELQDTLPLALLFFFLHLFLKLELLKFGLCAPPLGTGLKHVNAATVDRYTHMY